MERLIFLLAFVALMSPAIAQEGEVFATEQGAIRGYDVVSYFKDAKPVKGKKEIKFSYNGATWLFSSDANLKEFKANPVKYVPQYGGYCAYGMSEGHKAPTQPDAWAIVDGKLYLNYDKSVQTNWKKDQPSRIKKADENWPRVKSE